MLAVLRPESLVLAADETALAWRGEVVGRRFAGGHVVYRIRLSGNIEVEVIGETSAGAFVVAALGKNELIGEMGVIRNAPPR